MSNNVQGGAHGVRSPGPFAPGATGPEQRPNCTGGVAGAADICLADREAAQAETVQGAERTRHLQAALDLYRKTASAANDPSTKIKALDAATRTLDAKHLNDPSALELTLRELIGLAPNDLQFMFRLSKVQEEQGELQASEDTQPQPTSLAPLTKS